MPQNQGQAAQREPNLSDSFSDAYGGDDIRERTARRLQLYRLHQASLRRPPNKHRGVRQYRERRLRASDSSTRTVNLQDRGRGSRKNPESHQNGGLNMTTRTGFLRSMTSSSERAQERTVSLPGPYGRKIERSKPFLPTAFAESSRCGERVSLPIRRHLIPSR